MCRWLNNPDPNKVGMFVTEVIDLNFLCYQVIVVLRLNFLAVQLNQAGDDDDFLFYGDLYAGLLELPGLGDRYMRVKAMNCLGVGWGCG